MKKTILFTTTAMILLLSQAIGHAAIITVNAPESIFASGDGLCSLAEAIVNANMDAGPYTNCAAGNGTDTIVLSNNVVLNQSTPGNDLDYGYSGTPIITSPLIIDGQGYKIYRNNSLTCNMNEVRDVGEFRLLIQVPASNSNTDPLTLKNLSLENGCIDNSNSMSKRFGGGLYALGPVYMQNVTFKNNKAISSGGAFAGKTEQIESSTFVNNYAAISGGAIYLPTSAMNVINNTFSSNVSGSLGGAIFLSFGTLTNIENNTFAENSADNGGAIYARGNIVSMRNNIFSHNSGPDGRNDCGRTQSNPNLILNGFNNISTLPSFFSGCPGLILPQLGSSDVKPLANNGGPTLTHALEISSTAIDKAINGTSMDQRGRNIVTIRDLGAFEVQQRDYYVNELAMDGFNVNVSSKSELFIAILCSQFNGNAKNTINLSNNITFNSPYEKITGTGGVNGTPIIVDPLIIDGQGFTLKRDNALICDLNGIHETGEFRLFENKFQNNFTLKNITLDNGCADGTNNEPFGGALYNDGDVSLINVQFNQNQSHVGGGAIYHKNARTINEITNSTFTNNFSNGIGGAIYNQGDITTIQNTTFSGNSALDFGGAINNEWLIINLFNNTFSNNDTVTSGGAIANFKGIGAMRNNTFSANSSANNGGAIFNNDSISSIENNTFSGNSTNTINGGGAIYNSIGTNINTLKNSLFHNNTNKDCVSLSGAINGNNNISDNTSSGCPGLVATILTSATVNQLADNGGLTKTHGLQPGSQALDAAVAGLPTDQRGLSSNGSRDIGAYEAQSNELCSVALQVDGFNTVVANVDELNTAINCSKVNGTNPDTITLSADITLLFAYENDPVTGLTGTPGITTPLVIDGQGFMIQRDVNLTCNIDSITDADEFRLLHNHLGNSLTLTNIKLNNGCIDGPFNTNLGSGGGVYNEGNMAIINNSFTLNKANLGGAIFNINGTITEITSSTFSANSADRSAGAIYNLSDITTIQNSTFSGNQATNVGGAIANRSSGSITNILNSTFSGNTSPPSQSGGAINNAGIINFLKNSLFHNNSSSDCAGSGSFIFSNNNISDDASSVCPGLLTTTLTTSTLAPLADYGGLTQTHTLLAGSEAFNAAGNGRLANDQRGFFASDGARDIGAVEDQAPTVTAPMDITVEATGLSTQVTIEPATVIDPDQPDLIATTTSNTGPSFSLGQHTIIWNVTDNHGRTDSDSQTITVVDTTPPLITLLGSNPILRPIGFNYIDAGATAADEVDGFFNSASITVVNTVNTAIAGNYTITYDVQDNAGNNAIQATRLVKIQASIGGNISGLVNANKVTISDGVQSLVIGNGNYTFSTILDSGTSYSVSITAEPNDQSCSINNNSGTITDSNINNINITCGPKKYFIGGMASGLEMGNPVVLALDTELLTVNNNTAFVFISPLLDAADYTVSIDTLPFNYTCDLVNPTGTIAMDDVTDVEVNCTKLDVIFIDGFEE